MIRREWTFVALAVLLAGGLVLAGDTGRDVNVRDIGAVGYIRETAATSAYRSTLDGGEAAVVVDGATLMAVQNLTVSGYQTVAISGRHSVSGATCQIRCARYYKNLTTGVLTYKSMSTLTLTANTVYTSDSGKYPSANPAYFDTHGADVVIIFAEDPSSGTINLWAEVF